MSQHPSEGAMPKPGKGASLQRRRGPTDNYAIISNDVTFDKEISLEATGLLTMMLSRPADWQFYLSEMSKHKTNSLYAFRKALNELIDAGYVRRMKQLRKGRGRFGNSDYEVDYQKFAQLEPNSIPPDGDGESTVCSITACGQTVHRPTACGQTHTNKTYSTKTDLTKTDRKKASLLFSDTSPEPTPVDLALADPESSEARALLAANGINPDRRPLWELEKLVKRLLGTRANHPQVVENLEAWSSVHNLTDVRTAWQHAIERYKLEPGGTLRPVHFFVDLLNGDYKPHASEVRAADAFQVDQEAQRAAAAPQRGQLVRHPDGQIRPVKDFDPAGNWLVFDGANAARPQDCEVIQ